MYRFKPTNLPTVIIKRRRRDAPPPNHSGAWKVAYADFVTAMMSFFLLLWLLSVTTGAQRVAISNYFDPDAVSQATNGAGGVLGGRTIVEPGQRLSAAVPIGIPAQTPSQPDAGRAKSSADDQAEGGKTGKGGTETAGSGKTETEAAREEKRFEHAEAELKQAIQSVPELQPLARNLIVDETPEGLRIQIVDQDGASMFPLGSADMLEHTKKLMALVGQSVAGLPNPVSIRGHTDANPYRGNGDRFDNWDLSTERANASRRALEAAGLRSDRIIEVVGKADTDPLFPEKPLSAQNRRISILLLRSTKPNPASPQTETAPTAPPAAR